MNKLTKKHEAPLFEVIAVKKRNKMFFQDSISVHARSWSEYIWPTTSGNVPQTKVGDYCDDNYSGGGSAGGRTFGGSNDPTGDNASDGLFD